MQDYSANYEASWPRPCLRSATTGLGQRVEVRFAIYHCVEVCRIGFVFKEMEAQRCSAATVSSDRISALRSSSIRVAEIMGALSYALDMTEGQPPGHCVRCCWMGMQVGQCLGFSADVLADLYYTLLLKDLGCSSNAALICELYLADDLTFKKDFKLIDSSLSQVLGFVLSHTGLNSGLAERFSGVLNILKNGGTISSELIETRCQRGAEIARAMHFPETVARGILDLDEHFDGGESPKVYLASRYRRSPASR